MNQFQGYSSCVNAARFGRFVRFEGAHGYNHDINDDELKSVRIGEFANQKLPDQYRNHPDHISFVQNRWLKEVENFLEIDYQKFQTETLPDFDILN